MNPYVDRQFFDVRQMLVYLGTWVLLPAAELAGREPDIIDAWEIDSARLLLGRRVFEVAEFEPGEAVLPSLITIADQWEDLPWEDESTHVKLKTFANTIKVLAPAGADFREVMTAPSEWPFVPHDEFRRVREQLIPLSDDAIRAYHESDDPVRRRALARTACSLDRFPELLEGCVRSDAISGSSKEFDELISYVTPYWTKEYQLAIERSRATVARSLRLPDDSADSVLARLSSLEAAARPDAKS
jgi:hypothetical protein